MRFYKTRPLRIISGATILLVLTGLPVYLGLSRSFESSGDNDLPGILVVYSHGLSALGMAGAFSLGFAVIFSMWLIAGEHDAVNRKYLGQNARRHHGLIATLRTLSIITGGAGLIVGSLSGLYMAMIQARPEAYDQLPLPFFTNQLALTCLIGGGLLYAAGRIGR